MAMINIDDYSPIKQDQILSADEAGGRLYTFMNGDEPISVPSVTTIMQIVDKSMALTPWSFKNGVTAAHRILTNKTQFDPEAGTPTLPDLFDKIKEHKLTSRDMMEAGGDRGNIVHSYLEQRLMGTAIADVELEGNTSLCTGYFESVERFLNDYQPEVLASEIKVVSIEHMFAGRLDHILKIGAHPKGRRHEDLTGQTVVMDAKTNEAGSVYPRQHLPQVEAYKGALKEMTRGKLDYDKGLVVAFGNGVKKLAPVVSYADYMTFVSLRMAHRALERMQANNPNGRS